MRRFASRGLARRLLSSSSASASPPPGATAIPPLPSTAAPPVVVPFSEVAVAKHRVAAGVPSSSEPKGAANPGGVVRTPCTKNTQLSAMLGCELYLKKEHQQRTGSFKDRGACNGTSDARSARRLAELTLSSPPFMSPPLPRAQRCGSWWRATRHFQALLQRARGITRSRWRTTAARWAFRLLSCVHLIFFLVYYDYIMHSLWV